MKSLLLAVVLVFVGCNDVPQPVTPPPPPSAKVIGKDKHIESHYNILTSNQVQETVYTIYLDDGRKCDVDGGTFFRVHEGDAETCGGN